MALHILVGGAALLASIAVIVRNVAQAVLQYSAVAKTLFLCVVVLGAIRLACSWFTGIFVRFFAYRDLLQNTVSNLPTASFSSFPALAFVNSFFPVAESLTLSFALLGLWVAVLTVKFIMWVYNKIPLKAA